MANRGIRTDDELGGTGFFEDHLQDAVLQLDLEPLFVSERQERSLELLQSQVRLEPEFLLGECRGHANADESVRG